MLGKDMMFVVSLGTVSNFPWEIMHSLLYRGIPAFSWKQHLVCCGFAAFADGMGIAAIFLAGVVVWRESRWTRQASLLKLAVIAMLGLAGAVIVEQLALKLDWWAYGPAMPRLPGTELGISPLVQFVMPPPGVLLWALPHWWDYRSPGNA